MRIVTSLVLFCLALCAATLPAAERPEKPNFIIIFIDDMGYGDVGFNGAQGFTTPNIDRMAKEGMNFTDFYVNCAVCSGSRAGLLTGCHYQRVSMVPVMFPGNKFGLHPEEDTIADVLKRQGYATACIGKWHQGHLPQFLPRAQGFDSYFGVPYSNDMTIDPAAPLAKDVKLNDGWTAERIKNEKPVHHVVPLYRNEEVIEYPIDQSQLTRLYTEESIKFIKANKDQPFFLYLPHNMCHVPLHASADFKGKTKRGLFGDVIEELDWSVGQILKTLKAEGIDEKTLVIFTSDNGAASGSSLPLRGKKGQMYEGGVREPCVMRWPGQIPAGKQCHEVAATIDLLPTLAFLSGASLPQRKIDGRNIWPLMAGAKDATSPHEYYVLLHANGSVRSGQWKYYPWAEGTDRNNKNKKSKNKDTAADDDAAARPKVQLYDLSSDLAEKHNIAAAHPDVVARMQAAFAALKQDIAQNKRPLAKAE